MHSNSWVWHYSSSNVQSVWSSMSHSLCRQWNWGLVCMMSIIDLKVARSGVSLLDTWLFSLFSAAQILSFLYVGVILRYPQPIKSLGENTEDNGDVLRPLPAPGELHLSVAVVFTFSCSTLPCSLFKKYPYLLVLRFSVLFLWQSSHFPEYKSPNSIWLQFKSLKVNHSQMLKENKGVVKVLRKICRLSHSTGKLVTGSIQVHVNFLLHFFCTSVWAQKGNFNAERTCKDSKWGNRVCNVYL